jgi:hypothetical protein
VSSSREYTGAALDASVSRRREFAEIGSPAVEEDEGDDAVDVVSTGKGMLGSGVIVPNRSRDRERCQTNRCRDSTV